MICKPRNIMKLNVDYCKVNGIICALNSNSHLHRPFCVQQLKRMMACATVSKSHYAQKNKKYRWNKKQQRGQNQTPSQSHFIRINGGLSSLLSCLSPRCNSSTAKNGSHWPWDREREREREVLQWRRYHFQARVLDCCCWQLRRSIRALCLPAWSTASPSRIWLSIDRLHAKQAIKQTGTAFSLGCSPSPRSRTLACKPPPLVSLKKCGCRHNLFSFSHCLLHITPYAWFSATTVVDEKRWINNYGKLRQQPEHLS